MLNFDPFFRFLEYLINVPVEKWLVVITLLALVIVLVAIWRLVPRPGNEKNIERRK